MARFHFTYNSRKCQPTYGDRKQLSGGLGISGLGECGEQEGRITKGQKETFGHNKSVYHPDCGHGFTMCVHVKNLPNYTLEVTAVCCLSITPP